MMRIATFLAAAAVAWGHGGLALREIYVCCGCGSESGSGTYDDPLNDVSTAQSLMRSHLAALRRDAAISAPTAAPPPHAGIVWLAGVCTGRGDGRTLRFDARDSGLSPAQRSLYVGIAAHPHEHIRTSLTARAGGVATLLTPGVTLTGRNFTPVTDAAILLQLPAASHPYVTQISLPSPSGGIPCRTFAAGSAEILPATLTPTQSELFALPSSTSTVTDARPMRLAEWPNVGPDFANPITSPALWPKTVQVNNRTATLNVNVSQHVTSAGWQVQVENDPGSVMTQYYSTWFSDCHWQVLDLNTSSVNVSMTLGGCGNMSVGETRMGPQQAWRAYNLLSELDMPGEYTLNLTAQVMYAWLPINASEAGDAIVAALSGEGDVIDVTNATDMTFDSLFFGFARGAGIVLTNASRVVVANCNITCVGVMAVNITDGGGNVVQDSVIRDTGNGGVYIYSGDRVTLTPGNNLVTGSDITRVNRYTACYVPAVALNGVGNAVKASQLYNLPHSAVFVSGNNHVIEGNNIHDAVVWAGDSGAIYAGRDTTYRGNVVSGNTFSRLLSLVYGVYSIYLDDYMSGWTVTNNTFFNTSCSFLGGGRDNVYVNNSFNLTRGCPPIKIDARCSGNTSAQYPPILTQFLARVPYNTSTVWIESYPHLPNVLNDDPCWPKYNAFINNTFCGDASSQFATVPNATLVSWGSVEWGNIPVACPTPPPRPMGAA